MRKTFTLLIALMALCATSWATPVTWGSTELATVNVPRAESQTISGITVSNVWSDDADYCHFLYDNDYCSFRMNNDGSLVFAPTSGQLTSIVITLTYEPYSTPPLAANSGWSYDDQNGYKIIWTGNASSVVLKSSGSDNLSSGPITSIAFTYTEGAPTPSPVTWQGTDLTGINVAMDNGVVAQGANQSQTVSGVTVTANAPAQVAEEYNYSSFSTNSDEYGTYTNIQVGANGTLTFAPASGKLASIVITYNGNSAAVAGLDNLPSGWSWNNNAYTVTWTGNASSVVLASATPTDPYNNSLTIEQISSIVFTFAAEEQQPDTRKVPDFRFSYNSTTEQYIVKDSYGWIFEPGTIYYPNTEYDVYVLESEIFWDEPSTLSLPMTYSVDNDEDVITLTPAADGNGFSFVVNDYGDAVITASTVGNEEYQPASATLTIHVIEGKAPTKECVLAFVGGPHDGELVPDDYKFELQTGDEIQQMELREKADPTVVYAPSHSIWGSQHYYVACLEGEKKLRALTAGDDVFTVQYARYVDGDANGQFRTIEIPVHIKPSKPALASSLNLSTNPASNPNMVFNANYNGTNQSVQVAGTLTNAQVKYAFANYAYGTQAWKDALPNTVSFELPAGPGSFEITCQVQSGYEVRVLKFGDANATCFNNTDLQTHVINYDIQDQKAVVIYVAEASSPNNAPNRAPAATKDDPLASLTALTMSPTYPMSFKADPDNVGVYYSTHYNNMQKYLLPAGTEAYVATISGTDLIMTKVAEGGQVIPADKAFILKSTSASVNLTPTDEPAVTISDPNQLLGVDAETAAPANCYVLSGHSTDNSVTGVGLYRFTGTIPAHKAYLIYSGSGAPQRLRFVFNNEQTATGIDNASDAIKSEKRIENGQLVIIKNGVRYNAQGQIVK